MRINKNGVIRLSANETKLWEDGGPDGYEFRTNTRAIAQGRANGSGVSVEIYASKTKGGWRADQIMPSF